jgi:hypothetical protein
MLGSSSTFISVQASAETELEEGAAREGGSKEDREAAGG